MNMPLTRSVCLVAALSLSPMPTHAETAIGALAYTYHFDDTNITNEQTYGLFIRQDRWAFGAYKNSFDDTSLFVAFNEPVHKHLSITLGVASGYDGQNEAAINDYALIVGFTVNLGFTRTLIMPKGISFGAEAVLTRENQGGE